MNTEIVRLKFRIKNWTIEKLCIVFLAVFITTFLLLFIKPDKVDAAACWCVGPGGCPAGWSYGGGKEYCSPGLLCCNESGPINPGYGGFIFLPPETSNNNNQTNTQPSTVTQKKKTIIKFQQDARILYLVVLVVTTSQYVSTVLETAMIG